MKNFTVFLLSGLLFHSYLFAQQHSLQKLWSTDTIIPDPESILYNAANKLLYVSLMDGPSSQRDGKGGIGKISADGKIISLNWISGLNAPKGMGIYKGKLYVADLTEVVIIDIKQKTVVNKISIDSSLALNDITVDKKGVVYVSDPKAGKIFILKNGTAAVYIRGLIKPNGLKAIEDHLYVLANGSLYRFDKNIKRQTIARDMDENTDGIEPIKKGGYIISCWIGIIYYVTERGDMQVLLDNRKKEYYTADIGYSHAKDVLYVPSLFKKTVTAYLIK